MHVCSCRMVMDKNGSASILWSSHVWSQALQLLQPSSQPASRGCLQSLLFKMAAVAVMIQSQMNRSPRYFILPALEQPNYASLCWIGAQIWCRRKIHTKIHLFHERRYIISFIGKLMEENPFVNMFEFYTDLWILQSALCKEHKVTNGHRCWQVRSIRIFPPELLETTNIEKGMNCTNNYNCF
jgi:hypothetical protein